MLCVRDGRQCHRLEGIPFRRLKISILRENHNTGIIYFLRNGRTKLNANFLYHDLLILWGAWGFVVVVVLADCTSIFFLIFLKFKFKFVNM